jgi:MOSC domain-containing protein YiiM
MRSDVRQKPHYERGTEIRNHRQVSLVEETELDEVAAALGVDRLGPGLIADNIYLSGAVGLTTLPRMTRLVFPSGAVLMLGGENDPCTIAGALVEAVHGTPATAFPKAAIHKRGVTGWVEHPGEVRPGDTVEIRI